MFDPKTKKFPYPEKTDGHYLKIYNDLLYQKSEVERVIQNKKEVFLTSFFDYFCVGSDRGYLFLHVPGIKAMRKG